VTGRPGETKELITMTKRSWTIGSVFTVAMASMLLGAVVTTQVQPREALADAAQPQSPALSGGRGNAPVTLDTFRDIAKANTAGVVNINTSKVVRRGSGGGDADDLFERFFGPQGGGQGGRGQRETQRSLGTGFIIDKDGLILTNRHVVDGAEQISVEVGGKRHDAKLIGKDARTDVALLKIEPKVPLTVVKLGDSDRTEVGEWVMAIGNPFGLGGNSVTVGVVSYKGRPLQLGTQGTSIDMIQTDASINPGNSGGPLINTLGEVIGINTLIITRGMPQSAGVGFAVPINVAKEILPQLRDKGRVTRGWLGVQIQSVTDDMARTLKGLPADGKGAIVSDVTEDSPARKAGVQPGDVVLSVDEVQIEDNGTLSSYIARMAPGTTVRLTVLRDGERKVIPVTLGTFPDEADEDDEEEEEQARLGMGVQSLTPQLAEQLDLPRGSKGVVVMSVEPGEEAEEAGLQRGDVIVSVNGREVADVEAFTKAIDDARPEGLARLRVRRGTTHTFLVLRIE
jgi:serine protease Do